MPRNVTVGVDGSPESRAAAEWAAQEAGLLGLPLRVVHAWQPVAQAPLLGVEASRDQAEQMLREVGESLRLRHSRIQVNIEYLTGRPVEALCEAASGAELLVLGSRALGGVSGFVLGSVGLSVAAHAKRPVVFVRADEDREGVPAQPSSGACAHRPVVLGLDTASPDDSVIQFAFDAAMRRSAALRVVHGWYPPPYFGHTMSTVAQLHESAARSASAVLTEVLRSWRQRYPDIEVAEDALSGSAARLLVDASRGASLVVVGRRARRGLFGTHIGPVAHGVLHHTAAPVAVVAHD
ncbi:universal stress protein [Streptomyces anandii]|uniref:universal stress protein n=1 Tax=Streptomyces anandii TaxID=285454 RepID=UPI00167BDE3B|nr:universal stress protein [Streptomyces anandii]GGX79726.1 stress-inducible protein [Streptomyces anandii JCM 4720]